MARQAALEQVRRILIFAAGPPPRLSAASWQVVPTTELFDRDLTEHSDRLHDLLLELAILIQMEVAELVDSPLTRRGRYRLSLGADPPLRLLDEWEQAVSAESVPWMQGVAHADRERAFRDGLARARALADAAELAPGVVREIVRRLFPLAARADARDDLPGLIAGHSRRFVLVRNASGRLSFRVEPERGRGAGVVHTPSEPVTELLRVLWPAGEFSAPPMFCDPACGSGQFLLAAAERLAQEWPRFHAERELSGLLRALRGLHGVEIDPAAARIAAWNLSYWAACQWRDRRREADRGSRGGGTSAAPSDPAGPRLDALFGLPFPYGLGTSIQVGNALQVEPSTFAPGFLWERRFAEVFERERPGFDLVAGNPPWISYGLRDRGSASPEERIYYERIFPAGTQYKLTLYPIFMELALRICRAGGMHGFLVPDSLLSGHHFSRIRQRLTAEAELIELTLFEGSLWPGVQVGHTLFYAARKRGGPGRSPVTVRNRVLPVIRGRIVGSGSSSSAGSGPSDVRVPAHAYSAGGGGPLRIFRDDREVEFLARVQAAPLRFKDVCWTYSGLIARYGQKSVQADEVCAQFRLVKPGGEIILEDVDAAAHWRPALLTGAEVVPFSVRWRGGHLYWPGARADLARVYKSGFDPARYEGAKVLLRQTGDSLIAAVDRAGRLCLNNLHLVGPLGRPAIPPPILAALLMSEPVQRAYRISALESSRPLAQVDLKTVEMLPYPSDPGGVPIGAAPPPPRSAAPVRRLLRRIARALSDPSSDDLVELARAAWSRPEEPVEEGAPAGRNVLTLILLELSAELEARSAEPDSVSSAGAGRIADGVDRPEMPILLGRAEMSALLEGEMPSGVLAGGELPDVAAERRRTGPVPGDARPWRLLLDRIVALCFDLPVSGRP